MILRNIKSGKLIQTRLVTNKKKKDDMKKVIEGDNMHALKPAQGALPEMDPMKDPRFLALQKQNDFENNLRIIQTLAISLDGGLKDSKYRDEIEEIVYNKIKNL